jgi:nanoRNase/pAp phosphatase (c-di-AMP/oligoRNAs hydrolase)
MSAVLDLEKSTVNVEALLRICGRRGRVLVLMQDNPDPDAIASAMAVRELVRHGLKKHVTIGYGGVLGRAENRAMVHELHVEIRRVEASQMKGFKTLCLVDTQPRAGNNALLRSRPADIVIDHHIPAKGAPWQAKLRDVRPEYGASSTILYEYVTAAGLKPSPALATALFYGIETDTQDLGREASRADIETFQALVPLADARKLARMRRAPVSPEYFAILREGLTNAVVAGRTAITLIRGCKNPDIFAEVAEMILRADGVRSSVCYGPCGDMIHLSARAVDARGNAAYRMKRVVSRLGTGGGHRSMAGGQIPITADVEKRLHLVHSRLLKYFARTQDCRPLLPTAPAPSAQEDAAK